MPDKFKKVDKHFILSDSSVNEYGFRMLTSGYQADEFLKNPIGYYMHRREDGVALKWEDLHTEGDKIYASPVINLSNDRGLQTCDEVENGFLNAASMGHIVVLEYSTDPELMLPGQTGPTITKWYNKECSLVDIPGNSNALTQLYDAQENEINLADFSAPVKIPAITNTVIADIHHLLGIADAGDNELLASIKLLAEKVSRLNELKAENLLLHGDKEFLQQEVAGLKAAQANNDINIMLDRALEDRKITVELKNRLATDYARNADGLKVLLAAMPAYRSIVDSLKNAQREKTELQWSWDDFEERDPTGKKLKELKANNPERYKEIFKEKFEAELINE